MMSKSNNERLHIRVPAELKEAAGALASRHNMTVSQLVIRLLSAAVAKAAASEEAEQI